MMRRIIIKIWISILVMNMAFHICRANRFYCMGSGSIRIHLDHEARSEYNIVPEFDVNGEESRDTSNGDQCTWQFNHHSATAVNIILQGIDRKLLRDVRLQKRSIRNSGAVFTEIAPIPYEIRYPRDASCGSMASIDFAGNLTIETFKVISLLPGDTLTVRLQRQQPNKSPFALRLTAIDVGYCTRLTTLHGLNCHHITIGNLTLSESFEITRQSSMQLASFESLMDVHNFIESNKVPEDVFPMKQPLDLTNPVRIGLFKANDGQLKRFVKSNGKCEIETSIGAFLPNSKAQCVSLRVHASGSPVIELVDCNQPLPALISFPETPLRNSCLDCSSEIENVQTDGTQPFFKQPTTFILLITGTVVLLLSLLNATLSILIFVNRKRLTANKNGYPSHLEQESEGMKKMPGIPDTLTSDNCTGVYMVYDSTTSSLWDESPVSSDPMLCKHDNRI